MKLFYLVEDKPDLAVKLGDIEDGQRVVVCQAPDEFTVRRYSASAGLGTVEVHPCTDAGATVDVDLHTCSFNSDGKCRVCHAADMRVYYQRRFGA